MNIDAIAGPVLTTTDDGYDEARRAWNLTADQRPDVVAYASDASDVVAAVRHARERGLRVAVQGTGHAASSMGDLDGTLLLKTEHMTRIEIDPEAGRARAEA
jgi:FAD/FMN-containing dehydrogenase